jgi:hypothetical protein
MIKRPLATELQKETFKKMFADIVKFNEKLKDKYKIQFFDTVTTSNYVIFGLDGKSINVLQSLTLAELDDYRSLKNNWQS